MTWKPRTESKAGTFLRWTLFLEMLDFGLQNALRADSFLTNKPLERMPIQNNSFTGGLKRLNWKEVTSRPVGLSFHCLDELWISLLKTGGNSWQKMERMKIINICPSFSAFTNINSWKVKSALSNAVSLRRINLFSVCAIITPIKEKLLQKRTHLSRVIIAWALSQDQLLAEIVPSHLEAVILGV